MKQIYFVEFRGPCMGQSMTDLVVGKSEDALYDELWPEACEWYEQWLDEEDFDEDGHFDTGNVDYVIELYNPDEHDMQLPGGPPSEKYLQQLREQCNKE